MRSCTPGAERALSLKMVPRIRKSSAWLYFFLAGLLVDAAGVGTEAGVCGVAGSCTAPSATAHGARSAAVQRTMIHCRGRITLLLKDLDGGMGTGGCQGRERVPVTPRLLLPLLRHHRRPCPLLPRRPLRPHHRR